MQSVRVALADIDPPMDPHPPWILGWPVPNDPSGLTAELAAAVRAALGGLEVVLLAVTPAGDLYTRGECERSRLAVSLVPWRINWVQIEVDLDEPDNTTFALAA